MAKEIHKSELPPDFNHILQEAQKRWLRPTEICQILWNYRLFRIAPEPPNFPASGSLFLFDRRILRHFRRDGHNWRMKKDGRAVKEAHERLKVGSLDLLHAYYAHGDEKVSFQRRIYWLSEEDFTHIVLVHYLEVRGSKQSFSHTKGAEEITGSSNVDNPACSSSFTSQSEVANPTMDAEKPTSRQFLEYADAEIGSVFNEAGAGLRSGSKTALDSVQFGEPFLEYSIGFEPALHSWVATTDSSNVDHSSHLETFMSEALYTNSLTQKEAGALSSAGMPSSQNDSYTDGSIRHPPSLDVFKIDSSRWTSNELAEVLITGTFLVNKEDVQNCKWSCMFGDVEVLAEVLADSSLCCYTPVHQSGRVPFYVTCSNRVACSEVREFKFRDSEAQYMETADSHGVNEMHLHIRLEKLLLLGSDDYEKYVLSGGDERPELIDTINLLMLDAKLSNLLLPSDDREFPSPRNQNHEKLVKEKLYCWLIPKIHDDGKGLNMLGKDGQGVIHLVAALGYNWAIKPIIAAGVHVNSRDARGWTALHWAASCGRERTVGTLIESKAASGPLTYPTPQFPSGRTPADLASENGHKRIAGFLAESSLTSHLSALASKESKGDNMEVIYGSAVDCGLLDECTLSLVSLRNARPGQNDMLHSAAVRIQNKFRGWKGKKKLCDYSQKIIKIQAHVRGHQVRSKYRKILRSVGLWRKLYEVEEKGKGLAWFPTWETT